MQAAEVHPHTHPNMCATASSSARAGVMALAPFGDQALLRKTERVSDVLAG